MATKTDRQFLDHLEVYLAKRDGTDKLLKILRYSSKIVLASNILIFLDPKVTGRLKEFESSVGTSRKAYRLGKFVQDVNALRKVPLLGSRDGLLELVAYTGEGIYYFLEQFVWLVKAGLIDKHHARRLQKVSAWAEFVGYFGSVALKFLHITALLDQEAKLVKGLDKKNDGLEKKVEISTALRVLRDKRVMKTLSLVQDLSDTLLALSDIRDGQGLLGSPFLLASAGLISAIISTHKNWVNC